MDQPIDWRSESALLGLPEKISPPSVTPDLYVVLLMWLLSNTVVKIGIKMRTQSLLSYIDP